MSDPYSGPLDGSGANPLLPRHDPYEPVPLLGAAAGNYAAPGGIADRPGVPLSGVAAIPAPLVPTGDPLLDATPVVTTPNATNCPSRARADLAAAAASLYEFAPPVPSPAESVETVSGRAAEFVPEAPVRAVPAAAEIDPYAQPGTFSPNWHMDRDGEWFYEREPEKPIGAPRRTRPEPRAPRLGSFPSAPLLPEEPRYLKGDVHIGNPRTSARPGHPGKRPPPPLPRAHVPTRVRSAGRAGTPRRVPGGVPGGQYFRACPDGRGADRPAQTRVLRNGARVVSMDYCRACPCYAGSRAPGARLGPCQHDLTHHAAPPHRADDAPQDASHAPTMDQGDELRRQVAELYGTAALAALDRARDEESR